MSGCFDGKSDRLSAPTPPLWGWCGGNIIAEIGPQAQPQGKDATVIAGRGRTLMPGLIDNHVHMDVQTAYRPPRRWPIRTWGWKR